MPRLSPLQSNACRFTVVIFLLALCFTYGALRAFDAYAISSRLAALTPFQSFFVFALILSVLAFLGFVVLVVAVEMRNHRSDINVSKPSELHYEMLAHQLRNPVSAIRWLADVAHAEAKDHLSAKELSYIEDIQDLSKKMGTMLKTFLDMGSLEAGTMATHDAPVKIDVLVNKVVRDLRVQSSKSHVQMVVRKPKPALKPIQTDSALLYQAISNILHNAIRYSRPGKGLIDISMSQKPTGAVIVEIRDEGIGIPADVRQHIFEKFYRAPNAKKMQTDGTGLGLYISKLIVALLGGEVTFVSSEGKGTTFRLLIPSRTNSYKGS